MGQYWKPVNLDKKEYINPHSLGTGLKLWEQLVNHPGTGAALVILLAAMPEPRGGGDFDLEENWHGPERKFPEHNMVSAPFPSDYQEIARQTIGRWVGDRVVLVGDYAEFDDYKTFNAEEIYHLCNDENKEYKDITHLVAAVIEHELCGKYVGEGWKEFLYNKREGE